MAVRKYSTPGVYRLEIDASNVTAPAGTSTGGIVIRSSKGPINRPVLISSDKELLDTFGKPVYTSGTTASSLIPEFGYGTYAALEFLKESNALYVGRVVVSTDEFSSRVFNSEGYNYTITSAVSGDTSAVGISAVPYVTGDQFDRPDYNKSVELSANFGAIAGGDFVVAAAFPGKDGDNIAVSIEAFSSACDWLYKYDTQPTSGNYSGTAISAGNFPIASKIIRIDVYTKNTNDVWDIIRNDVQTKISGSATSASIKSLRDAYAPIETFYGTTVDQLDNNGTQLRIDGIINGNSSNIYVKISSGSVAFSIPSNANCGYLSANALLDLSGGAFDVTKSGQGSDATNAWDMFASREFLPGVNILINPDWDTGIKQKVARIAATRMDCIATGQSGDPLKVKVSDVLAAEVYGYVNPSYMALYAGYDKIYDQYNDKFVYLPKAAFGAALMARTDRVANTWDAPAGTNRAIIPSFSQKAVYTDADIGQLYDRNINTSKSIIGTGSVMWGQKTAQLKASALDRINVRRLLVYLENTIEPTLQAFLFELNTDRTRSRITSIVDSFLNGVQGAGGVTGYTVICDSSNNTPDVIDNNQLFCDIYVQPSRVIEFITLRTIITRTGVSTVEI